MPIYAYKCASCGHTRDVLQKMSEAPLTVCPACGKASFTKQLTAAGFQLKGSGWYATDFKGSKKTADGDGGDGKGKQSEKGGDKGGEKSDSGSERGKEPKKADAKTGAQSDGKVASESSVKGASASDSTTAKPAEPPKPPAANDRG